MKLSYPNWLKRNWINYRTVLLIDTIYKLAENPRPTGCKKLKGREGCRVRTGDYLIIYEIFDNKLLISIVALGHSKDIYN